MNAVEIEEAVSDLAAAPFEARAFPFAFLTAFGNKAVTVQRLRAGSGNTSDIEGGVLQRNNVHMAVCPEGAVGETLAALRASPKTAANKVKFILATDGIVLEAEELASGEPLACPYPEFADHFGFFLPLAGISTVRQIKDNPVDIKATGRLNKLYVELLKDNPDWATAERRPELNRLMARLIFCMFAEDTGIFPDGQFTRTVEQMSDGANTHEVIAELFRAMATPADRRADAGLRPWADRFPFVNGGLFEGAGGCPRFSRTARAYLLRAAALNWREINPDIFGSMIQAVADDDERGDLGLHYTSVPNILKVLNPLFLDDLRAALEGAGDSVRKLKALRRRIAAIRVFDPACGSGNFLVIAYKEMRAIEHEIARRLGDTPKSWIKLDNFFGIEIKSFAAEIARLALLIAEFQCDCLYINQQVARSMVLPLHKTGQIRVGNALRLNWLEVCPPAGRTVVEEYDLAGPTGRLALETGLDGADEPETYICGNPPYVGSKWQTEAQRADLAAIFHGRSRTFRTLDYVSGWFLKAADYVVAQQARAAFVSTNSICQGEQVAQLWPVIFSQNVHINFAHQSFKWHNLAAHNAGVTVVIVGVRSRRSTGASILYDGDIARIVSGISPYLVAGDEVIVEKRREPLSPRASMRFGNHPYYATDLMLSTTEVGSLLAREPAVARFLRPLYGSQEFVASTPRVCVWVEDRDAPAASALPALSEAFSRVRMKRLATANDAAAQALATTPYRFRDQAVAIKSTIIVPRVTSERREVLPVGLLSPRAIVQDRAFALYDAPLWNMALIASRLHWVWIGTVCVRLEMRFSYSNTLGWNTFPVPPLTEKNKADLTRCAEDILLAREAHFPATIADLYDPEAMPDDLRHAHERNDETLERVYIGRTFRNDTERLEKLFDLYVKMTAAAPPKAKADRAAKTHESGNSRAS
ncbi:MAG: class I SAM-dependent DNA methyltransferase [Caulobacteraceae bacterium]